MPLQTLSLTSMNTQRISKGAMDDNSLLCNKDSFVWNTDAFKNYLTPGPVYQFDFIWQYLGDTIFYQTVGLATADLH